MAGRLDLVQEIADASDARRQASQQQRVASSSSKVTYFVERDSEPSTTRPELDEPAFVPAVYSKEDEEQEQEEETVISPISFPTTKEASGNCCCWWWWLWLIPFFTLVAFLLVNFVLHLPPTSANATKSTFRTVYPLHVAPHDTISVPLSLRSDSALASHLLPALENTFRGHFEMSERYECLCMAHVRVPHFEQPRKPYQVCAVYNRAHSPQLYMMVNPSIVGRSNQTDAYLEASIACAPPGSERSRARARHVFVEWTDPGLRSQVYARFTGLQAAAIQLALEEMFTGCT